MNAQGIEWNPLHLKITKTTLQAKEKLRWPITIWYTSSVLCHKWRKFRMQKLQWTRNGKSSRQSQHGNWRKSRARRRLFLKHKETKRKSTLLHWWTHVTSEKREFRTRIIEVQRQSRAPLWHCKRRLWSLRSFHWTGLVCVPNDCRKSIGMFFARLPGRDGKAADAVSAYTQVNLEDAPR